MGIWNDANSDGSADTIKMVSYTLVATNNGSMMLNNVVTSDTRLLSLLCDLVVPGSSLTCTGTYTLTQPDVDSGLVSNTGMADLDEAGPVNEAGTVPLMQNLAISLVKMGIGNDAN